jgi:hypothetical protein
MQMPRPASRSKLRDRGGPIEVDPLPFRVELWPAGVEKPERLLGRAATMLLAQAIYAAAQQDYAGQRITLSRGDMVLQQST